MYNLYIFCMEKLGLNTVSFCHAWIWCACSTYSIHVACMDVTDTHRVYLIYIGFCIWVVGMHILYLDDPVLIFMTIHAVNGGSTTRCGACEGKIPFHS